MIRPLLFTHRNASAARTHLPGGLPARRVPISAPQTLPLAWKLLRLADMRVLIADDQRDVGRSLADLVRCCGHEVVAVVGSGFEAINSYSLHHPDLVLMDYRMPKLNGGTACRYILAKDPAARVILVSGWSPSDATDESGAISFLPKPVDFQRLNAALQSVAETLPAPTPAEIAGPAFNYDEDWIDYSAPFVAQTEPAPAPFLPEPTPISALHTCELPSASSQPAAPSSDLLAASSELPAQAAPQAPALDEKKISRRRRSTRRRAR